MTKVYEVTIRPLGRENFALAAAYAAAAAPSVEGDQGQIGAYWRWTATARPELPPPTGGGPGGRVELGGGGRRRRGVVLPLLANTAPGMGQQKERSDAGARSPTYPQADVWMMGAYPAIATHIRNAPRIGLSARPRTLSRTKK